MMMLPIKALFVLFVIFVGCFGIDSRRSFKPNHGKCEKIEIPICKGIPYNETIFPNLMGHLNQESALSFIHQFHPLVKVKCSPDVRLFLCAMFAPVCTILAHALPPCRHLCLSAKAGCEKLMNDFNYEWPKEFDCNSLPTGKSSDELCVGDNQAHFSASDLEAYQTSTRTSIQDSSLPRGEMPFVCPAPLVIPPEKEYSLSIGLQKVPNCGAPCYKTFFDEEDTKTSHHWIGIWSILCACSCSFTLMTFSIDTGRFPYPERPIIYLTFSYLMISLCYIVGYASNESVACNAPFTPDPSLNLKMEKTIKQGLLDDDWRCTLLAMVLYFFTIASCVWWVVLTITWFLSAVLKWVKEAISAKSQYFHTLAWAVPSFMTIAVLITNRIDGDVLSGVCFVGIMDVHSLRYFVLAPIFVCLIVGLFFLIIGMGSLISIRSAVKIEGGKTNKLEGLIARIGVFSLLYSVPTLVMVGCLFYEQIGLPKWMIQWQERLCRDETLSVSWQIPCRFRDSELPPFSEPDFWVYMMKYAAFLWAGICTGFWVWSGKTIITWKTFYSRIIGKPQSSAYV